MNVFSVVVVLLVVTIQRGDQGIPSHTTPLKI